jgi:hypothetical protein
MRLTPLQCELFDQCSVTFPSRTYLPSGRCATVFTGVLNDQIIRPGMLQRQWQADNDCHGRLDQQALLLRNLPNSKSPYIFIPDGIASVIEVTVMVLPLTSPSM